MSANVRLLTPEDWAKERFLLLRFVRRHLDRHFAETDWRRLVALRPDALAAPGTAVAVARTAGGMAAGVAYASGFGEDALVFAVHPALLSRGIGQALLGRLAAEWGRLSCRVAADNPAGLAACFAAGLVAVGLERGPAGKPALRLQYRPEPDPTGASGENGEDAAHPAPTTAESRDAATGVIIPAEARSAGNGSSFRGEPADGEDPVGAEPASSCSWAVRRIAASSVPNRR
ncbi:GNAT family N-acetyltransferase [Cohnella zeiphila]|uniref:N-acetyltransferase domain-containing protein n=1 Tax=Cohnella zeiphila TaxID=2761120 RepID=A0A7X0SPB6_9BACL|nr:hypothetical protein [Cohnella zeiphila]MBB6733526.1 hypothetical protein [Cohnella zeiphila]